MANDKVTRERDPVHGDILLDPMSVALLASPHLQRLGRVYQLGYAHLVYRGGTHTRLSHVIGASHVAGQLVRALRQNYLNHAMGAQMPKGAISPEEFLPLRLGGVQPTNDGNEYLGWRWDALERLCRWAALLHDVGHVPLGHTLEDEFSGIYPRHDDFTSPRIRVIWGASANDETDGALSRILRNSDLWPESFKKLGFDATQVYTTVKAIVLFKEKVTLSEHKSFEKVLVSALNKMKSTDEDRLWIRNFIGDLRAIEGSIFHPFMADLVSDTICADYLDYLKRDALAVGMDVLRDDRVFSRFFVGKSYSNGFRQALALLDHRGHERLDIITSVVDLVRRRFKFAESIYYHKTKVVASAMFAQALFLIGKPADHGPLVPVIQFDEIEGLARRVLESGPEVHPGLMAIPSHLLEPEVGDEVLPIVLRDIAGKKIASLISAAQAQAGGAVAGTQVRRDLERCIVGVALLQKISRRELHKPLVQISSVLLARIFHTSPEQTDFIIETLLSKLREVPPSEAAAGEEPAGHLRSQALEAKLCAKLGAHNGSVLIYVPPRKSQAKGIETFALDEEGFAVPIGEHTAIRGQIGELNRGYGRLWKMIIAVDPRVARDALRNSEMIDELMEVIAQDFAGFESDSFQSLLSTDATKDGLSSASRFDYIPRGQRKAARLYQALVTKPDGKSISWRIFLRAKETLQPEDAYCGGAEYALRATVLSRLSMKNSLSAHPAGFELLTRLVRDNFDSTRIKLNRWMASNETDLSDADPPLPFEIEVASRGSDGALKALLDELAEQFMEANSKEFKEMSKSKTPLSKKRISEGNGSKAT